VSGVIAVLGFGEAGSLIARDLAAAGAVVRGFDPKVPAPAGVTGAGSDAEAVTGAGLVLSVNSADEAVAAFTASVNALAPGTIWADLNTASPAVKRRLAELGREHAVPVTDIAMMAPVPGNGLRVPMLASGDAAEQVAASCCAASSTRAWPRRSSKPWTRRGRPASRTGCARTSPRTWPRPMPRSWSGSSAGPGSTPFAAVTRWPLPPRCSPTWGFSPSWPTPAVPCTNAWPQKSPLPADNSKKRLTLSASVKSVDRCVHPDVHNDPLSLADPPRDR
jgi:NAD binding domain of 6-phosphogluconate dehydrogenase